MKAFGKYPTELCQDYAAALRAAGIKCNVQSPNSNLPVQARGLYEYSQLLVDDRKSKKAEKVIAEYESLAASRVSQIEKQAARGFVFALLALVAFLFAVSGIYGFAGSWDISNVASAFFCVASVILGAFALRMRKSAMSEPVGGGNAEPSAPRSTP